MRRRGSASPHAASALRGRRPLRRDHIHRRLLDRAGPAHCASDEIRRISQGSIMLQSPIGHALDHVPRRLDLGRGEGRVADRAVGLGADHLLQRPGRPSGIGVDREVEDDEIDAIGKIVAAQDVPVPRPVDLARVVAPELPEMLDPEALVLSEISQGAERDAELRGSARITRLLGKPPSYPSTMSRHRWKLEGFGAAAPGAAAIAVFTLACRASACLAWACMVVANTSACLTWDWVCSACS